MSHLGDELLRERKKRLEALAALEDRSVQIAGLLAREVGGEAPNDNGGDSLPGA